MSHDFDQDTQSNKITALVESPPRATVASREESLVVLWYCNRCTKLILPPGQPGVLNPEATQRFCSTCAPFEVHDAPSTGVFSDQEVKAVREAELKISSRRSKTVLAPGATPGSPRASARVAANLSGRQTAPSPNRKIIWAAVAALIAVVALVAGIFMKRGDKSACDLQPAASVLNAAKPLSSPNTARVEKAPEVNANRVVEKVHSDKEARQLALSKTSGLFADMHRPDGLPKNTVSSLPLPSPILADANVIANVTDSTANLSVENFDKQLSDVSPLIEQQKFSSANELLNTISKTYAVTTWWDSKKASLDQARETTKQRLAAFEQTAADASTNAATAQNLAAIEEIEKDWNPKLVLGDASAKPARRVLDAARQARERLQKGDSTKRLAHLTESFDKIEKKSKSKLTKAEAELSLKTLADLKRQLSGDAAAVDKFADRWAALNFDLRMARGPERLLYNLEPCAADNCELKFDFSNAEQLAPWKFEGDGSNSGALEIDAKNKALILKIVGEHFFEGKDKRAPQAHIPVYFSATSWVLEADLSVLKARERDKGQNLRYGIFVSDGGSNVVRFSAKESAKNSLHLAVKAPGVDDKDKEKQAKLPGKQEDKVRLRIESRNGLLAFGAVSAARPATCGRARIEFKPKFAGVYVESNDKEENGSVAITHFKISGAWDKEKLKAELESRRNAESAALKSELLSAAKTTPLPN